MKRLLLLLTLPLTFALSLACEGPPEEAETATDATTQMILTHLGMEERKASWLLPLTSPNKEIAPERWEELRSGAVPPLRVTERLELGMSIAIAACPSNEWCDVLNCDGVDADGRNVNRYDETEYPLLPQSRYTGGWNNCDPRQGPGLPPIPFRCNSHSGGVTYTGCWGVGCPTINTLNSGDIYLFTDPEFGGFCAKGFAATSSGISDMANIYPNNVFKDTVSSFRWGGNCNNGRQGIEFWDWAGYPFFSTSYQAYGPSLHQNQMNPGNDRAAALKACHN